MCRKFGIENEIIPRIAAGFGGGMGNTGAVCGAVVGSVMAIGLKKERGDTIEDWARFAKVIQEFRRRFENEMGTISCRELTGEDLTTEEGRERFKNSDTPEKACIPAVASAYRLVIELLKDTD